MCCLDQYSHGSDEQKSNGGESNTDGKHDSQSDNNKKDSERDDKGKYKDKEDDKGKDKKGGKNGRKIRSDSEDSDGNSNFFEFYLNVYFHLILNAQNS